MAAVTICSDLLFNIKYVNCRFCVEVIILRKPVGAEDSLQPIASKNSGSSALYPQEINFATSLSELGSVFFFFFN